MSQPPTTNTWKVLVSIIALTGAAAFWESYLASPCPSRVSAQVDIDGSYVGQSTQNEGLFVSARLTGVTAECLVSKGDALYEIAATAVVESTIDNEAVFDKVARRTPVDMPVMFEALSNNGVVLGSGRGNFRAGSNGRVSATLYGLSDDAMRRVAVVKARWIYGG